MTISVTQLNNYISGLLEVDGVLSNVSVRGEITNVKRYRDCWYFSLKDEGTAINCFSYLSEVLPTQGLIATLQGRVSYYQKNGTISFYVRSISVSQDKGAAYEQFLALKAKLESEGLFDESKKKPIPKCSMTVGIVTSETGAVIHDVEQVALRRQPFVNLILFPVKVQGVGADVEIANGIKFFDQTDVDVVIVGRGGGSNEDLSAFNSEIVVRAVAECSKPIVSAVGHGIDYTLCDYAADKRAATPSEAAELVTIDSVEQKSVVTSLLNRMYSVLTSKYHAQKRSVDVSVLKIRDAFQRKIDGANRRIKQNLASSCERLNGKLTEMDFQLKELNTRLSRDNPANILCKGYAVVESGTLRVLSATQLHSGDEVNLVFSDGTKSAVVK